MPDETRSIEDELTHRILDAYHDERPDPDPNRCSFERIADVLIKLTEDEYRALGERAFGKSSFDLAVETVLRKERDDARVASKLYLLVQRLKRELARAARRAYREHGNVRDAAKALGMPRSTFHEYLTRGAP